MRRLVMLVVTLIVVVCLSEPAGASTLRVRVDANDSASRLDIHKTITNLSATTMYLRLKSWDRFKPRQMTEGWDFALDTVGGPRFDRSVMIVPFGRRIECVVKRWRGGTVIGMRRATRPDGKSAACHLPRTWFGHIDRAVRFTARIQFPLSRGDLAPNHGVYRWV